MIARYATMVGLSYGIRSVQLLANIAIARLMGLATYAEFQTAQQSLLTLYFFASLGIPFCFSKANEPSRDRWLLALYAVITLAAAILASQVLPDGGLVLAFAYVLYSAYGLFSAIANGAQLFVRPVLAGALAPVALFAISVTLAGRGVDAAWVVLAAMSSPLLALLAFPDVRRAVGKQMRLIRVASSVTNSPRTSESIAFGLSVTIPIAAQSAVYSAFLLVASSASEADTHVLAALLPIYSLLLIAPSSISNMLIFQRDQVRAALVFAVLMAGGVVLVILAPLMVSLAFWAVDANLSLAPAQAYAFAVFCVAMLVVKILVALITRTLGGLAKLAAGGIIVAATLCSVGLYGLRLLPVIEALALGGVVSAILLGATLGLGTRKSRHANA